MKVLLDTHAFLWYCIGDSHLSPEAKKTIEDNSCQPLLSVASIWEMAIKVSLGKLRFLRSFDEIIPELLQLNGIILLPLVMNHCFNLINLPFYHRDPFDRLLVSQALTEQIPLISADKTFDSYNVKRIW